MAIAKQACKTNKKKSAGQKLPKAIIHVTI